MTRIVLHSDVPILAKGLEYILASTEGFVFAGACFGEEDLAGRIEAAAPDILLIDLTPDLTFGLLSELRKCLPNCKIILWVKEISTELAFQGLSLGVCGILRKNLEPEGLIACLRGVRDGGLWYDKALTDSFFSARRLVLTQRESQLVVLITQGLKNKEIATALQISEGTVKVYLARLFQKVGVKDRFELALFGLKNLTAGTGEGLDSYRLNELGDSAALRSLVVAQQPRSGHPRPAGAPEQNDRKWPERDWDHSASGRRWNALPRVS